LISTGLHMNRVHIIGPPRSGTTLMLELMISGFRFSLAGKEEIGLFDLPNDLPNNSTVCTKKPQDHRLLKHIIDKDEDLYFISMIRDPRDIVVSRHGKNPNIYWANLRQWRDWYLNNNTYKSHPRLLQVRYEDLVRHPNEIQQQLAKKLPFLQLANLFSEYHKFANPSKQSLEAMRNIRPVTGDSIGNWHRHLPRIVGQLNIHGSITDELIELGYEKNDQWRQVLDGVAPDTTPGFWPEFMSQEQKVRNQNQLETQFPKYLHQRGLL
jgi:hypothetical protein